MFALLTPIIVALLLLFNTAAFARSHHSNSSSFGAKLCQSNSQFDCYTVKRGQSWDNLYGDENKTALVRRINRMNTHIYPGLVLAIPKSDSATLMDFSPFSKQISPPGQRIIIVSLHNLAWGAYDEQGSLVRWGPASGARGYCPDIGSCHTPTGRFAIYNKEGEGCVSTKFPIGRGGAPMPYCMFFHGGFALHGSYEVPGYNASHGCVRIFVDDAEWLNHEFTDMGTPVYITNN